MAMFAGWKGVWKVTTLLEYFIVHALSTSLKQKWERKCISQKITTNQPSLLPFFAPKPFFASCHFQGPAGTSKYYDSKQSRNKRRLLSCSVLLQWNLLTETTAIIRSWEKLYVWVGHNQVHIRHPVTFCPSLLTKTPYALCLRLSCLAGAGQKNGSREGCPIVWSECTVWAWSSSTLGQSKHTLFLPIGQEDAGTQARKSECSTRQLVL